MSEKIINIHTHTHISSNSFYDPVVRNPTNSHQAEGKNSNVFQRIAELNHEFATLVVIGFMTWHLLRKNIFLQRRFF